MSELLTCRDLKKILKCSQSYAYTLSRSGKIPVIRVGNGGKTMIRFKREDVERFLQEHTVNGR